MKKADLLKVAFLLLCSTACARDFYLQARGAYFYPTNHRFRESYSGSGIYGLEFDCQLKQMWVGWIETDYYTQKGYTQGDHNSTRVAILRNSVGLKILYDKYCIRPYIGLGPAFVWLHTHVDSSFLIRSASKWGVGALVKTGAFFMLPKSVFIDVYADYLWQTMNMRQKGSHLIFHRADISGFSLGAGIGYRF